MAERNRKYQTEKTKQKIRDTIKTNNIIEKLQEHVLGVKDEEGKVTKVELKATQIKAAEVLLNRTMPVLSHNKNEEVTDQRGPQEIKDQLQTILNNLDDKTKEQLQILLKEPECHNPGDQTPSPLKSTEHTSLDNKPKDVTH